MNELSNLCDVKWNDIYIYIYIENDKLWLNMAIGMWIVNVNVLCINEACLLNVNCACLYGLIKWWWGIMRNVLPWRIEQVIWYVYELNDLISRWCGMIYIHNMYICIVRMLYWIEYEYWMRIMCYEYLRQVCG